MCCQEEAVIDNSQLAAAGPKHLRDLDVEQLAVVEPLHVLVLELGQLAVVGQQQLQLPVPVGGYFPFGVLLVSCLEPKQVADLLGPEPVQKVALIAQSLAACILAPSPVDLGADLDDAQGA